MGFKVPYIDPKKLSFVLTEGEGTFQIIRAEQKEGKKFPHYPQFHLVMEVTDSTGKTAKVDEYLVDQPGEDGQKILARKIMQIANSIGHPELYAPGVELEPEYFIGQFGACTIKTEPGKGEFSDRSKIDRYISAVGEDSDTEQEMVSQAGTPIVPNQLPPQPAKPVARAPVVATPYEDDIPY